MTPEEKAQRIIEDITNETGTDPSVIFRTMAAKDYISVHGPEHHILDGACLLTAFHNAGGGIDLNNALEKLMREGLRMPGAMCGLWGVCGAVTSIGAALSIIDGTGPLSEDGSWGRHMAFTSDALRSLGEINGPRCCKRDALIAFEHAVDYINAHYPLTLGFTKRKCEFTARNPQCIRNRCPYFGE